MLAVFGKLFVIAVVLVVSSDIHTLADTTGWDVLNSYEPVFNTLVLVLLAYLGNKRVNAVKQAVQDTHASVGHTADAASAAASAAADTARISKDIGAIFRDMQTTLQPPAVAITTGQTDQQQERITAIERELTTLRNRERERKS